MVGEVIVGYNYGFGSSPEMVPGQQASNTEYIYFTKNINKGFEVPDWVVYLSTLAGGAGAASDFGGGNNGNGGLVNGPGAGGGGVFNGGGLIYNAQGFLIGEEGLDSEPLIDPLMFIGGGLGNVGRLGKVGITGFTGHGINQAISRGIKPNQILDAVKNSLRVSTKVNFFGRTSIEYIGKEATVVLNSEGKVVTVHGTHSKLVEKLLGVGQ